MPSAPADLAHGVFSDTPPWTVDPAALAWRRPVPALRAEAHRRLPSLLRPPRLPPVRRGMVVTTRLAGAVAGWMLTERRRGGTVSRAGVSRRLRVAAERLGPTFIKLGQIISSGEGIFPAELVAEFVRCRDRVPPEDFCTVRRIVEEDLGLPLAAVFEEFEESPVAAASIAQVHRARLRRDLPDVAGAGSEVVVKVQRPTVAARVLDDLRVLAWLAPKLVGRIPVASLANPPALVEVFAHTISEELDFRIEADNMLDVARVLAELDQRRFVIPRPHPTLVTRRVLVMERLDGFRFDDLASYEHHGIDTHGVVRAGMIAFMEGALIHGVFHGDLHGGNLFVRPDGRTALLDFGITGRLSPPRRRAFVRLLVAGTMNDVTGQLAALRDLGALPAD
ncbi:MAG: AarF/ABC1/UbiB kinase family protein, partial [Actinomyces sp.]